MVLGRITHYAFDAILLSAFLAGVKRSTGLTPSLKSAKISENDSVQKWVDNYLWVGEVVMDQGVALMSSSGFFERKSESYKSSPVTAEIKKLRVAEGRVSEELKERGGWFWK